MKRLVFLFLFLLIAVSSWSYVDSGDTNRCSGDPDKNWGFCGKDDAGDTACISTDFKQECDGVLPN